MNKVEVKSKGAIEEDEVSFQLFIGDEEEDEIVPSDDDEEDVMSEEDEEVDSD